MGPQSQEAGGLVLVSACLLGERCRWHGRIHNSSAARKLIGDSPFIMACPELLGGLSCPRTPVKRRAGACLRPAKIRRNAVMSPGQNAPKNSCSGLRKHSQYVRSTASAKPYWLSIRPPAIVKELPADSCRKTESRSSMYFDMPMRVCSRTFFLD